MTSPRHFAPYRISAAFYDHFSSGLDYAALGGHLADLIARFAPEPEAILELGAGTCPLSRVPAFPQGAKVIYSDLSPHMLRRARPPAPRARVAANALALPFRGPFDVCVMLMDAINYLLVEEEVLRCLREVHRVLRPGGLFILNIASESAIRASLKAATLTGSFAGAGYVIETRYEPKSRLLRARFTFHPENGNLFLSPSVEVHEERMYRIPTVSRLAKAAGFSVSGCFEDLSLKPADGASETIHFALTKPQTCRPPSPRHAPRPASPAKSPLPA